MTHEEIAAASYSIAGGDAAIEQAAQNVIKRVMGCTEPLNCCGACQNALRDVQELVRSVRERALREVER